MKNLCKIVIYGSLPFIIPTASYALGPLTPTVSANAVFITPLAATVNNNASFGYLKAATGGTYVLSTADVVTASAGGVTIGGTPLAASLSITGSGTQLIDVIVTFGAAVSGVTPSLPRCLYGAGSETACDVAMTGLGAPTSGGTTLLIGMKIVADGVSQPDSATPINIPIPVTISYN